jgi:hypothetical protein
VRNATASAGDQGGKPVLGPRVRKMNKDSRQPLGIDQRPRVRGVKRILKSEGKDLPWGKGVFMSERSRGGGNLIQTLIGW